MKKYKKLIIAFFFLIVDVVMFWVVFKLDQLIPFENRGDSAIFKTIFQIGIGLKICRNIYDIANHEKNT